MHALMIKCENNWPKPPSSRVDKKLFN